MESEQSDNDSFTTDRSFKVEDFSSSLSLEVERDFMEPSGPEPYHFKPLAQGADSVNVRSWVLPRQRRSISLRGRASEGDGFIPERGPVTYTWTKLYCLNQ
ncbi:hypothetical protein AMECASPLE_027581 [Ameca splendens]|uniref:Uncharacterized protein n=1 Tax=Ameca splendens TaxID=208324 RepID=A0ABV0ZQ32_9TELE